MKHRNAWLAAGVVLIVHALGNAHYGFFRDELYFIICGQHPQFGYVDQPPVVPLLAALTQLAGHSLWLLRIVPALFGAAGAFTTVLLAEELGGGAVAQWLAALVYLFCPVLLSFGGKASTDEVGLFTWVLLAYLVVRIAHGADRRLWLVAGAVAGISLESKYSVIFFLVAIVGGLLLTRERRILGNRYALGGLALAIAIALPNALWQMHYGFPMWQLLEAGQHGKNVIAGPLLYLFQELLITNIFLAPIWIAGVVWLLRRAPYRFLGFAYLIIIAEMIVLHGKHYYPAAVYPIVIAAGGVALESWMKARALRIASFVYVALLGPVFVPLALPVLPVEIYPAYQQGIQEAMHVSKHVLATEHGRDRGALPGDWADMHGWPELAAIVARVYDDLPAAQRARAVVVASNYGEASAIEFFAPGVPVVSGHNQYWLWGTKGYSGDVVIDVHGDCGASEHLFATSRRVATVDAPYAIGYERGIPVMLCTGLRVPLAQLWPELKNYI
ncbi:MAG: glycosyltransferase family 39 protein [bacterium]|nr:glycosyltransferase family 39 protein [bacterium]